MIKSFWGIKIEQKRFFDEAGNMIPVSVVGAAPMVVTGVKSEEKDGYEAIQVGIGQRKIKNVKKPVLGKLKKAGVEKTPRFFREVKVDEDTEILVGKEIKIGDVLGKSDIVGVTGIMKGRGFSGVMKKWGFAGGPRTHGQSDRQRAPGSIGATTTPGRVLKGKKMAGRYGGERKTITNLEVVMVDEEKEILYVSGLIPGAKGGLVEIYIMEKKAEPKKVEKVEKEEIVEKKEEGGKNG